MSGKTDSVVVLEALLAVPALAVLGAAHLTGKALSALREEYRAAKEASEARLRAEQERREAALRARQGKADEISSLVAHTRDAVANREVASAAVHNERVGSEPSAAQSDVVLAATGKQDEARRPSDPLLEEIKELRAEIAQKLPDTEPGIAARQALLQRLEDIERLTAHHPAAARQSLRLLRERLQRHIKECREIEERAGTRQSLEQSVDARSEHQTQVQAHAQALEPAGHSVQKLDDEQATDSLVEIHARLELVLRHSELPALHRRAIEINSRLNRLLETPPVRGSDLSKIRSEVDALVGDLVAQTAGQEVAAVVSHHVKDVLLTLGYNVSEVGAPSSSQAAFVAPLAPGVGVEFSVTGSGQLTTEMVALSGDVSTIDPSVEEAACSLAEKVRAGLNQRGLKAHEKTRYRYRRGDILRRVIVKGGSESTREAASAEESNRSRRLAGEIK